MSQEFSRTDRVSQEIFRLLSNLLRREVKDPRLQGLTLTECKVSKDLSVAKVYFTVMGAKEGDQAIMDAQKALEKARGFFRSELGKQLRLRITPDIRFHYDTVPDHVDHIEQLIKKALY
ncbi:30S ribosome-binding factor RbfA [Thiomicrospira microaerophila]|uniref:30S ribosome-binding factor RbfA n=1 Tax=Thiomicrospira microaerophila TaxID=406020 RepID=UPI00200F3084|nr:30S ribosome-binding factor RbfA [Thiomicrospira microaerophila]UQB43054.1 30S ribosome-binding factor RbfA [Thiomicrospira microaerophila]